MATLTADPIRVADDFCGCCEQLADIAAGDDACIDCVNAACSPTGPCRQLKPRQADHGGDPMWMPNLIDRAAHLETRARVYSASGSAR